MPVLCSWQTSETKMCFVYRCMRSPPAIRFIHTVIVAKKRSCILCTVYIYIYINCSPSEDWGIYIMYTVQLVGIGINQTSIYYYGYNRSMFRQNNSRVVLGVASEMPMRVTPRVTSITDIIRQKNDLCFCL